VPFSGNRVLEVFIEFHFRARRRKAGYRPSSFSAFLSLFLDQILELEEVFNSQGQVSLGRRLHVTSHLFLLRLA